jgi:hypothetical protein
MLVLLPIVGRSWLPTAGVLAVSALIYAFGTDPPIVVEQVYGLASWALAALFAVWLVPVAARRIPAISAALRPRPGRR